MAVNQKSAQGSPFNSFFKHDPAEIDAQVKLVEFLGSGSNLVIIELGAGIGETSVALSKGGHFVYAFESDLFLYSILNFQSLDLESQRLICLPISAEKSPFIDEIDVVCAFDYFTFLTPEEKVTAIKISFQALKNEGFLILSHSNQIDGIEQTMTGKMSSEINSELTLDQEISHVFNKTENLVKITFQHNLKFRTTVVNSASSVNLLHYRTPQELIGYCAEAGFQDAWVFKDLSMNSYDPNSQQFFIVARK